MHHTVEDTGIVLGQAFREALAGFAGVRRFGHAYIPMDETLTRCAVDLSNRPYLIWRVKFDRPKIGEMDTELFKEFHHAFAMNAGACVHLETPVRGKFAPHRRERLQGPGPRPTYGRRARPEDARTRPLHQGRALGYPLCRASP